jgi:archaeal flagellar protein FlaF
MGFSTSGATAVVFVALMICFGTAYAAVGGAYDRVADATDAADDRALDQRNTAIEIESAVYEDEELTVVVENTGTTALSTERTSLVVDGEFVTGDRRIGESDDRTRLLPGDRLTVEASVGDEPDRVRVTTDSGISVIETEIEARGDAASVEDEE